MNDLPATYLCPHKSTYFDGLWSLIGKYRCEACRATFDPFAFHMAHGYRISWGSPYWNAVDVVVDTDYLMIVNAMGA